MLRANFAVTKFKNIVPQTYVIGNLNDKEIVRTFYKKRLTEANQKEFMIEKAIKRNGNEHKWKSYDNSFNSCIEKKILIYKNK